MLLARIGLQMVALVLVLVALERFHDPVVAGAATFLSIAPGLVVSPIAGALLDRHGRTRLVIADYSLEAIALGTIALLASRDLLTAPLLLVIVAVSSLTNPLSSTGIRTLFPVLVPERLWERANAIDSNGYVIASIVGPAAAGALVATAGTSSAMLVTAAVFALAALVTIGLRDPGETATTSGLLRDAWAGVLYVARHPTLRALAVVVSTSNIGWGLTFLALPVLVLTRLGQGADLVGLLFALVGVAGSISVLVAGRISSVGREGALMGASMLGMGAAFLSLAIFPQPAVIVLAMLLVGIANGPYDVVLFTLRQRRTDPSWLGRAFAVSMALNYAGFPVGSAAGGVLVAQSVALAFVVAAALEATAAFVTFRYVR
jgi:MFS family permease